MDKEKDQKNPENKEEVIKPDPETLHKTDPQEHMEGPVSSLVKGAEDIMNEERKTDDKDEKTGNEAEE